MPWRTVSVMDQRREFVRLAMQERVNRRELCKRFGVSPDTGYRWLARHLAGGDELADRSRRPYGSPSRCAADMEARVVAARDAHPGWGGGKNDRWLYCAGWQQPAPSRVHKPLPRKGRVSPPIGGPKASQ